MYGWSVRDVWVLAELTVMVGDREILERTLEDLGAGNITIQSAIHQLRDAAPAGLWRSDIVACSPHLFPTRTGLNS